MSVGVKFLVTDGMMDEPPLVDALSVHSIVRFSCQIGEGLYNSLKNIPARFNEPVEHLWLPDVSGLQEDPESDKQDAMGDPIALVPAGYVNSVLTKYAGDECTEFRGARTKAAVAYFAALDPRVVVGIYFD